MTSLNSSVYVHIPFCEQRCYYCAFTVAVSPESAWSGYVDRVIREIELSGFDEAPPTIYFGGGTPSLIGPELLDRVLGRFPGTPAEITIEANPGTLSSEKIRRYREMRVTRISLGAQSLEDEDLERAGRLHKARHVRDDFAALRNDGFANINLDLIAGLPGQRFETWERNLAAVIAMRPEHVSVYMLDHEERSAWGRLPESRPDEEFARFYTEACGRLDDAGYVHYEISNWALPSRECVHNLRYWDGSSYRGFGVSAHSHESGRRFWNTTSLAEYARCIDAARLATEGEEQLDRALRLEERFMLGLRQMKGLNISALVKEFGFRLAPEWYVRVQQLEEAGWITFDGATLKLTPAGWVAANSITEELLWPTPTSTFEATP
jgi:oxygen-independent coproporphyrinogen-3 oxidase